MEKWKIIGLGLLVFILTNITACNPLGEGEEVQLQVEVIRSDLYISVSGSGNIEASEEAKITFGTSGRLDVINVEKGDIVIRGELVAKLETDALELAETQAEVALTQKQVALTTAKVTLTQAQLAQKTAEYNLKNTRDTEGTLELALANAQIDVRTAKFNLEKTSDLYTWSDIKTVKANVDDAQKYLDELLERIGKFLPEDEYGNYPKIQEYVFGEDFPKPPGYEIWQEQLVHAQSRLNTAKDTLDAMLSGSDTEAVAIKKLQLETAEKAAAQAQKNLNKLSDDLAIKELEIESAKESVEHARQSLELAKQSVALARQSLTQAQKNLAKATITAPFDGVITAVNAEKGDTITTAMTIADMMDPSRMELIIELDEIDVPMVKVGQEVIISLDALPDSEFAGVVSAIFPMPKEVGGVVLYDIEVTLNVPEDSGIRIGMSASADIVLDKRTDVLLIPYRAINEDEEGNTFVNVVIDEEPQERPVTLGVSDGFDTEVISGLTEGEMVIETRFVR